MYAHPAQYCKLTSEIDAFLRTQNNKLWINMAAVQE